MEEQEIKKQPFQENNRSISEKHDIVKTEINALEEWQEKYQRLAADFANYKRRVNAERADLESKLKEKLLKSLLTIYDDFARLNHHKDKTESLDEGIRAVQKSWQEWLENNDIRVLHPQGEEFDHNFHDAVLTLPVEEVQLHNKIVEIIANGYTFQNKVLRHAKVAVGRYTGYHNKATEFCHNHLTGED